MLKEAIHLMRNYREPTTPLSVAIDITSRCNSKCVYCEIWKKKDFSKDLSVEDVNRIVDQAEEAGIKSIILSGGEATLYSDLFPLLEDLRRRKFHTTVLTNALLFKENVNEEKVRVLNDCVDSIQFSLDSADQKNYTELRGVPGVDRVAAALDRLTKPSRGLSCVVSSENYWEIDEIIRFGSEHKTDYIGFQPLNVATVFFDIPVMEGKEQYLITKEKFAPMQEAIQKGVELGKKLGVKTNLSQLAMWIEPFFTYSQAEGPDYFFNHVPGLKNFKCIFPFQSVYINAEGEMTPCRLLPGVANVKGKNFVEEWRTNPKLNNIREGLKKDVYFEECKTCYCQFPPNMVYSFLADPIGNYQLLKHVLPEVLHRAKKFV